MAVPFNRLEARMPSQYSIIYVQGYAGTQSDVEETVDDPTYGFNMGSNPRRP
jgi:hypothetical protein